jgi:hypothetical protein
MKFILVLPFIIFKKEFYKVVFGKIVDSYWFRILKTPSCWIRNSGYKYNEDWDKLVNTLIDFGTITSIGNHAFDIRVNDTWIWIKNYPYCFAHPCRDQYDNHMLTSRKTAFKLHDKLQKEWNLVDFFWHLREEKED